MKLYNYFLYFCLNITIIHCAENKPLQQKSMLTQAILAAGEHILASESYKSIPSNQKLDQITNSELEAILWPSQHQTKSNVQFSDKQKRNTEKIPNHQNCNIVSPDNYEYQNDDSDGEREHKQAMNNLLQNRITNRSPRSPIIKIAARVKPTTR
ncbi:MAG: hypothetical protein Q8Q60_04890 [Candidatus Chromulinivorax sp.]|nr:hypothetical protein [Candidatus Chromulinivorax sp.]